MRGVGTWVLAAPFAAGGSTAPTADGLGFAMLGEFLLAIAGWPAPPKGTKKPCPCIRVSLRSTSLVPSLLRGSPRKGHPCRRRPRPFTALAASMPLAPLLTDSTRPSERGDWRCLLGCASKSTQGALLSSFDSLPALSSLRSVRAISKKAAQQNQPLPSASDSIPRQEAERRRCAGRRARSEGTGTSLREGAPSPAPVVTLEEGEFCAANRGRPVRMSGSPSLWLLSLGETRESDAPCEAQPAGGAKESAAPPWQHPSHCRHALHPQAANKLSQRIPSPYPNRQRPTLRSNPEAATPPSKGDHP